MHVAVEHAQRRGNHPRLHVVVQRHGGAVDGLGVAHGVLSAGQRDLRELFGSGAVFVEMTLRVQRHQVDAGQHIEGREPLPGIAAVAPLGLVAQGTGLFVVQTRRGFGNGAENQDVPAQAGGDGHGAIDHAGQRTGALVAGAEPVEVQAQGAFQGAGADRREGVAIVVVPWPAGHTIDVVALQAGVGDGFQAGIKGQAHGRFAGWPGHLGLADAGDGDISLVALLNHH